MASDVAAKKLIEFMKDDNAPYSVKLAAARDLLDRADLAGKSTVEVEMPKFEQLLHRVVSRRPRDTNAEPRVIEGAMVEPEPRALGPGEEPDPIEYTPGRQSIYDSVPSPPPAVHPVDPVDDTLNGVGRASHGIHDVVEGSAGAKAMERQANARSGVTVRRATRTDWRP